MGWQLTLLSVVAGLLGALPDASPAQGGGQAAGRNPTRPATGLPPGAVIRLGEAGFRPPSEVYALAYSPDRKYLATAGDPNRVCLWDAATGRLLREITKHRNPVRKLVFSPDSDFLASVGVGNEIRVRALADDVDYELTGADLAFSADGRTAFVGGTWQPHGEKGSPANIQTREPVRRWDLRAGKPTPGGSFAPLGLPLGVSPDGRRLATFVGDLATGKGHEIHLWDVASGKPLAAESLAPGRFAAAAFAGQTLVVVSRTESPKAFWLRHVGSKQRPAHVADYKVVPTSVTLSADGARLAISFPEGIKLWDVGAGKWLRQVEKSSHDVYALALSPDAATLAVGGAGPVLELWNVVNGERVSTGGHTGGVTAVAVSRDGARVLTAGSDRTIRMWDVKTGAQRRCLRREQGGIAGLALSADDRWLAAGGYALWLWDTSSEKHRRTLTGLDWADDVVVSPEGEQVAAFGRNSNRHPPESVCAWDTRTGRPLWDAPLDSKHSHRLSYTEDGRALRAVDAGKGVVREWDAATGRPLRSVTYKSAKGEAGQTLSHAAFSADGRLLVSAHRNAVTLWEAVTGTECARFPAGRNAVTALAVSPAAPLAALGEEGGGVSLVDLRTGQAVGRYQGHRQAVTALTFTRDGRRLVSGSADTTAVVWQVPPRPPAPRTEGLPTEKLDALWQELAGPPAAAYGAKWQLVAAANAVPFLDARLHAARLDAEKVARLITDLGDKEYKVRQRATDALARVGPAATPALERALAERRPLEVKRRLREVLEKIATSPPDGEQLRLMRAVEVLERVRSAAAREVLTRLAGGAPAAPSTREARAALRRLGR